MKTVINKLSKIIVGTVFAVALMLASGKNAKADELTDALLAQQAAIYQQQLAAIQAYQQQVLAQQAALYQQAIADQNAKALLVFQEAQANQLRAIQQAYMLNSIQQQQQAQYTSMLQTTGLDYQQHLIDEYNKYQKQAITAFKGYEGIK